MDRNLIIDGKRIYLRPYSKQVLKDHVAILNDWTVTKWLSNTVPYPYTKAEGEKFLERDKIDFEEGNTIHFAIMEKETDRYVGGIKIFSLKCKECEVGYWMGQDFWGMGYGTEVLKITIDWIKLAGNVEMVFAITANDNKGSRRILEKVGFVHKGSPPVEHAKCGHGVACSEYYVFPLRKEECNE